MPVLKGIIPFQVELLSMKIHLQDLVNYHI